MKSLIQLFLLVQFAVFVFAANAHFGLFGAATILVPTPPRP